MNKLIQIFQVKEIRNSIFFVLAMLFLFRVFAHIPIPGVNAQNLEAFFQSNQLLGLVNLLSGGGLENFSLAALGVAPYITASIIFQLLVMIVPRLEELQKEGESGQQKINQWTRLTSIPLAFIQSFAFITLLRQQSSFDILGDFGMSQTLIAMISMTAGTIFLMWIGELISEKQIGNGISIMILASILAGLPRLVQQTLVSFDQSQVVPIVMLLIITIFTVVAIVIMAEAVRKIPVSYARMARGGAVDSHLPIRVNMAGVIPIIFAISVVLFPPTIAQFLLSAQSAWVVNASNAVITFFNNSLYYGIIYFILVVAFTFFYTSIIFKPDQIAENLQKQGAFIPGIRPGKPTENYLAYTMNRIVLTGAIFLGLIAVLPLLVEQFTGTQSLVVGGTSILIIVAVVIEMVQQINAKLTMRDYEAL